MGYWYRVFLLVRARGVEEAPAPRVELLDKFETAFMEYEPPYSTEPTVIECDGLHGGYSDMRRDSERMYHFETKDPSWLVLFLNNYDGREWLVFDHMTVGEL